MSVEAGTTSATTPAAPQVQTINPKRPSIGSIATVA